MHIKCLPPCTISVSPKKNNYFLRIPFSSGKKCRIQYTDTYPYYGNDNSYSHHWLSAFLWACRIGQRLLRPPIWTEQNTGIWICIAWPLHLDFLELNFDAKTLSHLVFLELSYKFEFPSLNGCIQRRVDPKGSAHVCNLQGSQTDFTVFNGDYRNNCHTVFCVIKLEVLCRGGLFF